MSRCFPYPPPGYVCNRATGDALIESIKIEKEKEKFKQDKKELKRREKEQKRREKKEKKKQEKERLKSASNIADESHKRKRDLVEKTSFTNSTHVYLPKKIEPEAEQLERSSLTEEYGQPIVTESLCYSSDGAQSRKKKCKIEQSPIDGNCTSQGKVIRFRLKKRDHENVNSAGDIPSTSGRTEYPAPKVVEVPPVKDTDYVLSRPIEQLKQDNGTLLTNNSPLKKVSKPKSAYDSLFSEWVPPPVIFNEMEVIDDDENWLFTRKKGSHQDGANPNAYDGLSGLRSMSLQPHAHLLPEVDLYALPYTVIF